jgi:uncharacterized repeat protein (TIGR03806 family)
MKLLAAAALLAGGAAALALPRAGSVKDVAVMGDGFPATLAEYGFFADAAAQRPARDIEPFRVQTPLWSDGADKLRFVYIPTGKQARAQGEGLLDLPVGAALIKTFKFGGKLIETRVLLHRAAGWVALPYRWNEAQTEARLVIAGARIDLTTPAGQPISYAIPNKNQCKECHALSGEIVPLGLKARNLSPQLLARLKQQSKLDRVPQVAARVPLWEDRTRVSANAAARGYLDANCAHCHNPGGSASNSGLDLRWEQSDPVKIGIMKRPVAAGRGSGGLEFDVLPGDPAHSILHYRMANLEGGISMPELGRSSIDPEGLAVVARWIREMKR